MANKNVFKTDFTKISNFSDPETLFHALQGRASEIKHLWSQQADLIRSYHKDYSNESDVALELPTGSGKTLVGLLIAEWRRRSLGSRVAYLCPTRQLANQVGAQASDYGINAHVLVGPQIDYPYQEFSDYNTASAIAVTTYSAVFNNSPRINDAQTLILDDAHAGENFIASMWSVEISRTENTEIYQELVLLLKVELETGFYSDISDVSDWDPEKAKLIDLIAATSIRKHINAIRDLLDEKLEEKTSCWYAWSNVKYHLTACNFFISYDSILIRPIIPPTRVHNPFSQAKQRIYMSATLGTGGELERITGVKSIKCLSLPQGWDQRSSGRRLFLIPEVSISNDEAAAVAVDAVKDLERGLILVPTQHNAEGKTLVNKIGELDTTILRANDIEHSIESFTNRENVVLLLSRYDGLDLRDEACRLLIFAGLPGGTNLQEKFMWSRIGASSLLRNRIITRFVQGVGRCTRSDNDYAVVISYGRQLTDFLLKLENRSILNPELQAELEFGIENSKSKSIKDFKELRDSFLSRGKDWKEAEQAILALRNKFDRQSDSASQLLRSVVADENAYIYAIWGSNYEEALGHARKVADALEGNETKSYRAWWYYLSAEAAMLLFETTREESYRNTTSDLLNRASKCCISVSWFARLARSVGSINVQAGVDEISALAAEKIRDKIIEWGTVGKQFEQKLSGIDNALRSTGHKAFHQGLKGLGEILGFHSELPDGDAEPDCLWSIKNLIYVVHEAKTEHTSKDAIGANDIRQAQSHENWVRSNRRCNDESQIYCLIESPRATIKPEAIPHATSLCHTTPVQLKRIFDEIATILRRVRSKWIGLSDERVLEELLQELTASGLTPYKLLKRLTRHPVKNMDVQ